MNFRLIAHKLWSSEGKTSQHSDARSHIEMPLKIHALIRVLQQHMLYSEVMNCLNVWYNGEHQTKCWFLRRIVFWLWYQNHGLEALIHDAWHYSIRLKSSFDSSLSANRNQVLRWRPGVLVRLWWVAVWKFYFSIIWFEHSKFILWVLGWGGDSEQA